MPSQPSTLDVYKFLQNTIEPLFKPGMVVATKLVRLSPHVLRELNSQLSSLDENGVREKKRHGTWLDTEEEYGMYVENMTATAAFGSDELPIAQEVRYKVKGSSSMLGYVLRGDLKKKSQETAVLEFKPKWLMQSRDAPVGWTYCRTCALRRMRAKDKAGQYAFCPLDLVSGDRNRVSKSVEALLPTEVGEQIGGGDRVLGLERLRRILVEYIIKADIFTTLRDIQEKMDRHGLLNTDTKQESTEFLIAMTVRDCTAFVRIDAIEDDKLEGEKRNFVGESSGRASFVKDEGRWFAVSCRLADLDIKDGSGTKQEYWRSIERELNGGGWYCGRDDQMAECR